MKDNARDVKNFDPLFLESIISEHWCFKLSGS